MSSGPERLAKDFYGSRAPLCHLQRLSTHFKCAAARSQDANEKILKCAEEQSESELCFYEALFSLAKLRCEHKTREIMYPWAWGCGAKRDESAQSRGLRSIKIPFLSFALPAHSLLVKQRFCLIYSTSKSSRH
jgi:hypothetical protein